MSLNDSRIETAAVAQMVEHYVDSQFQSAAKYWVCGRVVGERPVGCGAWCLEGDT